MPCNLFWKIQKHIPSNFISDECCFRLYTLFVFYNLHVAWLCQIYAFYLHTSLKTVNRCSIKAQTLIYVLNGFYFALFCFAHFLKFETLKRLNDSICAFCMKGKYMIRKHYSSNKFQELRIFSTCQQRFILWERSILLRKSIT